MSAGAPSTGSLQDAYGDTVPIWLTDSRPGSASSRPSARPISPSSR